MSHDTETRPRQYASQILGMKTKEERQAALARVPTHLQALTRKHVEIAWEQQQRTQHGH